MRVVVVGLVEQNGQVLIARKRELPGHFLSGAWHVPGGRVEEGESLEDAVRRELREETALDVDVLEPLGVAEIAEHDTRAHWFRCAPREARAVGASDLVAADDVVDVELVTIAEALRRFPPEGVRMFPDAVRRYFGLDTVP